MKDSEQLDDVALRALAAIDAIGNIVGRFYQSENIDGKNWTKALRQCLDLHKQLHGSLNELIEEMEYHTPEED